MTSNQKIGRRAACAAALGAGAIMAGQSPLFAHEGVKPTHQELRFGNDDFYSSDGKFDEAAAKAACCKLMKVAGVSVSDFVRKNLWVTDFGLGRFLEVGLGGLFWVNEKKWNYASIEILLLPNQMIPEHWHVAIESEGIVPKMESWVVRYGTSYTYGPGKPSQDMGVKIPLSEKKFVTVTHETKLNVGEVTGLAKPVDKHWQQAGPEGAIVTEISTYHDSGAVRFTNPEIIF